MSTDPSPEHTEPRGDGSWPEYGVTDPSAQPDHAQPDHAQPDHAQGGQVQGGQVQGGQVPSTQWPAQPSGPPQQWAQQPAPVPQQYPPVHYPTSGAPQQFTAWSDNPVPAPAEDPNPYQRRIVPSAPAPRSKLVSGLLPGLLAGVLVAAPAGYFLHPVVHGGTPEPTASTAPAALRPFEQNQLTQNKQKFTGDLATLAQPWLPYMNSCQTDTDKAGGPKLGVDERGHVLCRYGAVFVHFAHFKGPLDRDRARAYRQKLNTDSRALAPAMGEPARKPRTSDGMIGTYVEYALPGTDGRPIAGVWWDTEDDKAVAIYLEARWEDTLGSSWEPLRDLWQTRS